MKTRAEAITEMLNTLKNLLSGSASDPKDVLSKFAVAHPKAEMMLEKKKYVAVRLIPFNRYHTLPTALETASLKEICHEDFLYGTGHEDEQRALPSLLLTLSKLEDGVKVYGMHVEELHRHPTYRVWFYKLSTSKRKVDPAEKMAVDFVNKNLTKGGFDFGDVLEYVFDIKPEETSSGYKGNNARMLLILGDIHTVRGAPGAISMLVRIMESVGRHPDRMSLLTGMANLGPATYKHYINLVILKYFMSMSDPVKALSDELNAEYRWFSSGADAKKEYYTKISKPFLRAVMDVLEQRIETAKARKS
jgi:hypothetical protein